MKIVGMVFPVIRALPLTCLVCLPLVGKHHPGGAIPTGERASFETLFYMTASEASFQSFRHHIDNISIVGPQVFAVAETGEVRGHLDPQLLTLARSRGVRVMPLVYNPGFESESVHQLLNDHEARSRAVQALVQLAERHGLYGWQFDFENVPIEDRDRLTDLYREAADALRPGGFRLSIAVGPGSADAGVDTYHPYLQTRWRGSFDLPALAAIGDFITLMTYAQHGPTTMPGPVAGLPWVAGMVDFALQAGVPPEKLSLGIPTFSARWFAEYHDSLGSRARGEEIDYYRARELLLHHGAEVRWLPEQGTSFAFWESAGTFEWLFLEDRRSFEAKLGLLRTYPGLRGISVWVLGAEDPETWPLLEEHLRQRH